MYRTGIRNMTESQETRDLGQGDITGEKKKRKREREIRRKELRKGKKRKERRCRQSSPLNHCVIAFSSVQFKFHPWSKSRSRFRFGHSPIFWSFKNPWNTLFWSSPALGNATMFSSWIRDSSANGGVQQACWLQEEEEEPIALLPGSRLVGKSPGFDCGGVWS